MMLRSANAGSTSQNATRFSLATECALLEPCPPHPTIPMLSSALGAVYPLPPRTWRGTIVGRWPASAAPRPSLDASATNSRRDVVLGCDASSVVILGCDASDDALLSDESDMGESPVRTA